MKLETQWSEQTKEVLIWPATSSVAGPLHAAGAELEHPLEVPGLTSLLWQKDH